VILAYSASRGLSIGTRTPAAGGEFSTGLDTSVKVPIEMPSLHWKHSNSGMLGLTTRSQAAARNSAHAEPYGRADHAKAYSRRLGRGVGSPNLKTFLACLVFLPPPPDETLCEAGADRKQRAATTVSFAPWPSSLAALSTYPERMTYKDC
jgi:hypothetical protein